MRSRLCALLVAIVSLLVLAGCGSDEVHNMEPLKRDKVAEYLKNNPQPVPSGWDRGVLILSEAQAEDCFDDCHTWHGTVMLSGGETVTLSSEYKDGNWIFDYLPLGADFMWKKGATIASRDDLKIIKAAPLGP